MDEEMQQNTQAFPYPCSDGSRTLRLLRTDIAFRVWGAVVFFAMFARLRRSVREQPDT